MNQLWLFSRSHSYPFLLLSALRLCRVSSHSYHPSAPLQRICQHSQVTQLIIQLLATASPPIDRMDAHAMYPVSLSKQSSSRIYQDLWATRLHSLVQLASDHSLGRSVTMETFKQVYANFPLVPFWVFLNPSFTLSAMSYRFVQPLRVTHTNLPRTPKEHHQSP